MALRASIFSFCFLFRHPQMFVISVDYVVQPHRYDILEDIGCQPAIYNTLPAYFLVLMWPVLLGLISFVYSGRRLAFFLKFHF